MSYSTEVLEEGSEGRGVMKERARTQSEWPSSERAFENCQKGSVEFDEESSANSQRSQQSTSG